jgi:hypothetical protein
MTDTQERTQAFIVRAGAHARALAITPRAQRWLEGVTDEDVAAVFYAIEAEGVRMHRGATGRWLADLSDRPWTVLRHRRGVVGRHLSVAVKEMIRTGLLRHWVERTPGGDVDHLIPALVHLKDPREPVWSACRFTGEDFGPMRSRLVEDLALVDCLECEQAVARGGPRGL